MPDDDDGLHLLCVEDDDMDFELFERSFRGVGVQLERASTGEAALKRLLGADEADYPDVVVLDLSLPGIQGHDVLSALKTDPDARRIPVIVLTSSANPADILKTFRLHGASHLIKPVSKIEQEMLATDIVRWWAEVTKLPA